MANSEEWKILGGIRGDYFVTLCINMSKFLIFFIYYIYAFIYYRKILDNFAHMMLALLLVAQFSKSCLF